MLTRHLSHTMASPRQVPFTTGAVRCAGRAILRADSRLHARGRALQELLDEQDEGRNDLETGPVGELHTLLLFHMRFKGRSRQYFSLVANPLSHHVYPIEHTVAVTNLEWQPPLKIVQYPDPRLRAPNAAIGCFDDSLRRLAQEMFELMYE